MILTILSFLLGPGIQLGYIRYNKDFLSNKSPDVTDIFSELKVSGKACLLRVTTALIILVWSLLFIVPGIIAAYYYVLAPFILEENPDISVREALRRSKEMMSGNKWNLTLTSFYLHIADQNM